LKKLLIGSTVILAMRIPNSAFLGSGEIGNGAGGFRHSLFFGGF